ncbi:MAG: Hpt domain-containing protein [Betaproteobacteria bacterium]|nr:Hpt domain-containing protein [Betaproteobacteria bacterium]
MTHANEPDLGLLTWVKGEIDQALSHADESLQAALGLAEGSSKIQFAQTHLNQAKGALSIIELDGLTRFVAALDLFLAELAQGKLPIDETQIALGRRALASIANYLEELSHGAPDQPLRLLPLYQELVLARGEAAPSPADLFFPDLSVRIPPRAEAPKLDAEQRQQQRRTMQQRFERGQRDWLRQSDAGAIDAMREALAEIELTEDNPGMRSLWWAGQAFIDTLSTSPADGKLAAKQPLARRIGTLLQQVGEGQQALPERLLRELLYHVASQPASTPIQQAVRQAWRLDALIPEEGTLVSDLPLGPLLQELHTQLTRIKDTWNTFGERGATALSDFEVQLEAFTKSITPIGRPVLYRLLGGMCRFIAWLKANPQRYSEPIALEFATALLLAEAALDRGLPDPGFQTQVGDALSRLEALARGEELGDAPPSATSVESARKQQEKEAVAQLSREILHSLATIEQTLDDFFRDHSKREPLETLHAPMHQITGALNVLGENEAISLVEEVGETIARLARQDSPVDDAELTEIARRLSALTFFIQQLPYNRVPVVHFLTPFTASTQSKRVAIDLQALPEIPAIATSAQTQVKPSSGQADGVEAFPVFEIETGAEPEIEEPPVSPAKSALPPTAATDSRVTPPQPDLDAELLPIFIEEAHEILKKVMDHLKLLKNSPSNSEDLVEIRRRFHTLKGSGRMVGLAELGEAAWGIEQTLNRWLQLEWHVTPPLLKLLATAHRVFTAWVNQIDKKAEYGRDVSGLMADAERLRSSGAPTDEPGPTTVTPEPRVTPAAIEPEAEILEIDLSEVEEPEIEVLEVEEPRIGPSEAEEAEIEISEVDESDFALAQATPEEVADEFVFDEVIVSPDEPESKADDEESRAESVAPEPPRKAVKPPVSDRKPKRPAVPKFEPFDFSPFFTFDLDETSGGLSTTESGFIQFDFGPPASKTPEPEAFSGDEDGLEAFEHELDEAFDNRGEESETSTTGDESLPEILQESPEFPIEAIQTGAEESLPELEPEFKFEFEFNFESERESKPEPEPELESEPDADTLYIGDIEISRALFELYVTEAQAHIGTLHQEFEHLADNPTLLLPEASLRAAHSCAGISGTARCAPLHSLGKALELAQQRIHDLKRPPTANELALLKTCADTLDNMLTRIIGLFMPLETPELIEQLDRIGHDPATDALHRTDDKAIVETVARIFPEAVVTTKPGVQPKPLSSTTSALPTAQDEIDEQLLPIFLEEAGELLNELHITLRAWNGDLANTEHSMLVKRQLHTLKGSARMAGAMVLGNRVHQLESRMESALDTGDDTASVIDEITSALDGIEQMVAVLAHDPAPEAPVAEAIPEPTTGPSTQPIVAVDSPPHASSPPTRKPHTAARTTTESEASTAALRVRAEMVDHFVNDAGEIGVARTRIEGELRQLRRSMLDLTENVIRLRNQLREVEIQADVQMQTRIAQAESSHAEFDPLEMDRYTRLQELTRMMAESVNDVTTVQQNLLKNLDNADFALHSQARTTRELQQALMQVRMVPFDSLTVRLYRIVRRGARDLGKRANLDLRGGGIEIDRSVLEHIIAPLEHLLRNALAHGIEPPEVRRAKNKPEIGQITLTTRQESNEIVIELADDGAGLDFERIAERALERGLIGPDEIPDERRLANLIFLPGFTTAEKVTAVSGRGVGMDVVKAETAAVGGRVEVSSTPGEGTMFSIYLPLTLAVTQALLVRSGTQHYAIPASMISQIMELKIDAIERLRTEGSIEWLGQHYEYRYLPNLLGSPAAKPEIGRYSWVLLLHSGAQTLALHVDGLRGHQEIIVKNAGPQLTRIAGMSGATVLGNGEIVLIINPIAMTSREIIYGQASKVPGTISALIEAISEPETPHEPTVMVVDDSLTVRKITSRLLEREGYRVITAKDGVDAIESLIDNVPDVILSDIEMPRMDGFDLVRNIRADARLRDVPIIMITSRLADKHRDYAMEIGANHYLGKPYQEEELLGLIAGYTWRA